MTRPAYLLPENPTPEGMICIPAYIPDDPLYIAAFWGQYDELTTWLAWERDAEHKGKEAATIWKTARDRSRDEWIEQGGCGGSDMLRQNEENPCLIERSTDNGETWETLVDMSLCKNESFDPYEGETPPQDAPVAAAASIVTELMRLVDWGIDEAETGEIVSTYQWYLRPWTNNNVTPAAIAWLNGIEDHLQDINDFGDSSEWLPFYNFLACRLQSARSEECNTVFCWLNEAAEDIYTWLNESSEWVYNTLEATARALGPQGLANMAAPASVTGFGGIEEWGIPDCEWEILLTPDDFNAWVMNEGTFYQSSGALSLAPYGGSNDFWTWIATLPGGDVTRLTATSQGAAIEWITYTEDPVGWVINRPNQHIEIAYNPSDTLAWGEFTSYDWHVKEWAFHAEELGNYLYKWEWPDSPENTPLELDKLVFKLHRDIENWNDRIVSITIRGTGIKPTWA
jgi:hypothetical protein